MNKVLITGSSGRIGQALTKGLEEQNYEIVPYDLPECDATNYQQLVARLAGNSALIHLAFDLKNENSRTDNTGNPDNLLMGHMALAAAAKVGVQTCIMGSSVNAARINHPTNESYRTTKLELERAARLQAERYPDINFVSVRFGRVTANDSKPELPLRPDQTWISHRDASDLARAILEAPANPEHQIVYGLSNRPEMPHDISNPYGWQPRDWFGLPPSAEL